MATRNAQTAGLRHSWFPRLFAASWYRQSIFFFRLLLGNMCSPCLLTYLVGRLRAAQLVLEMGFQYSFRPWWMVYNCHVWWGQLRSPSDNSNHSNNGHDIGWLYMYFLTSHTSAMFVLIQEFRRLPCAVYAPASAKGVETAYSIAWSTCWYTHAFVWYPPDPVHQRLWSLFALPCCDEL